MGNTDARRYAALVLLANSHKASAFLDERMRDGRITSRSTTINHGVFSVIISGPLYTAGGHSDDSEEDALSQAAMEFACWEFRKRQGASDVAQSAAACC